MDRVVEWRPVPATERGLGAEEYLDYQEAELDGIGLTVWCRPNGTWGWLVERLSSPVWDAAGNAGTEADAKTAAEKATVDKLAEQAGTPACQD